MNQENSGIPKPKRSHSWVSFAAPPVVKREHEALGSNPERPRGSKLVDSGVP